MKVKFLVDFRGRETGERYYQAGDVVEANNEVFDLEALASRRIVEVIPDAPAEVPPSLPPEPPKNKSKRQVKNAKDNDSLHV